jgi:hypothetical protein
LGSHCRLARVGGNKPHRVRRQPGIGHVLGDSRDGALNVDKVSIIAAKLFAPLFRQPFVLAEIVNPEIPDHDAARSPFILFSAKRPRQVEVWKSRGPSGISGTTGFDEPKAAEPVTVFVCIFDLQMLPTRVWNFDGPCLPRKLFPLVGEFAVELRHYPKEPVQIPHDYFGESSAAIFAERQDAPRHLYDPFFGARSMIFRLRGQKI